MRKLDHDDAEAWATLRREALEAHPLAFGASVPDDAKVLVEFIRTRLASSDESVVFGAFSDVSLVGVVGIARYSGKKERHKALIWGMYVAAGNRRHGIGEILLHTAIQQARSWQGIEQVHLAVSEVASDARRLYERNEFKEWGREPRALCWEGRCADETHMILDLRQSR
ncbi:MAG: GNAT family N-acetyltransferase [Armatimonadetes bacterium]|nr:GNAT family N-acetyltransferase [Armatimonadota bacterium]